MDFKKHISFVISCIVYIVIVKLSGLNWFYFGVLAIADFYYWYYINWTFWKKRPNREKVERTVISEWINSITFAVVGATLIHTFIIQPFTIPTSSMEKSMLIGDYLLVSKLSYGPNVPNTPLSIPFMHNILLGTKNTKSYNSFIQLGYNRLPGFNKVKNNDIVVFNYPVDDMQADMPFDKKTHYVKRCVGIGGDSLQIINQKIYVNNVEQPLPDRSHGQYSYIVKTNGTGFRQKFLLEHDITEAYPLYAYDFDLNEEELKLFKQQPFIRHIEKIDTLNSATNNYHVISQGKQIGANVLETYNGTVSEFAYFFMMLTDENAKKLASLTNVIHVKTPELLESQKGNYMFPKGNNYNWTTDNYGPIYIPAQGSTINLTTENYNLYKEIIENYESNKVTFKGDSIFINDSLQTTYTFNMNYYWMMGDNRHNSLDSRFWGFVPEDHVVGKPVFNWLSIDPNKSGLDKIRWKRLFTVIHGEGTPKSYLIHFILFVILWNIVSRYRKKKMTRTDET